MGGDPAIYDKIIGGNAFHWAIERGRTSTANVLYEHDRSLLETRDKAGDSPLDLARREAAHCNGTVRYLEKVIATAKNSTENMNMNNNASDGANKALGEMMQTSVQLASKSQQQVDNG